MTCCSMSLLHGLQAFGQTSSSVSSSARAAGPFRASPLAVAWGPPWTAGGCLLHHGPSWHVGEWHASPWSPSRDSALALEVPPPLLLSLLSAGLPYVFSCPYSSVSPTAVQPFLSTLKYLSWSHHHIGLRGSALPWGGSIGAGCTQHWAAPASQRLP